jgi:hypothetical protein
VQKPAVADTRLAIEQQQRTRPSCRHGHGERRQLALALDGPPERSGLPIPVGKIRRDVTGAKRMLNLVEGVETCR